MTNQSAVPPFTRRALVLATGGFALAGCALPDLKNIVGPPPPLQIYVLKPQTIAPAAPIPEVRWQLGIAVPETTAGLNTPRIAVNPTPTTMDYFTNAAWPDRAPLLMQALLVQAFENTRRVSVARDTTGLAADFVLQTELREFQAHYDTPLPPPPANPDDPPTRREPPTVMVQIEAKLLSVVDRRIIGSFNATTRATAAENSLEGAVQAFNAAVGQALGQIVDWTMRTPPAA